MLGSIGNQTIDEETELSFTATATDANDPPQTLTYSLVGAPAGASINSSTGEFSWTPTEAQGPGSYTFDVVVTDNGDPALSDSEEITVTVNEVNLPPVLGSIGDKTIDEESLLSFTATATDPDIPPNTLTFSLSGAVPTGASITSGGDFSWTPTEAQGPGSYTFDVVVSDGALTDSETITVTVNEVLDPPVAYNLELEPPSATNVVGTEHELTATVTDQYGDPFPGATVTWTIESGPGSFVSTEATTDSNGQAQAVITSTEVGTTTVMASVSASIYDTATKTWLGEEEPIDAYNLELEPPTAINVVGTTHELTATVTDQYGDPFPGAKIVWTIASGPGSFVSTEATTDINGQARAVITSEEIGTTTVRATVSGASDTATKTWIAGDAELLVLTPETATNPIGTTHELTATVTDMYGNPVSGITVTWTIESGPGSFVSTEATTDSNGQARAVITSEEVGTTTVKASVSGAVYDTATKTWIVGAGETLVLTPETATNQVDTEHELTATVTDMYGNPVSGITVTWTIESGPGSFVSTEATTDSNGQARAVITSAVAGTTTVKASVSELVYDTAIKTWLSGEGPETLYFTVDFLGEITRVPMAADGSILEPLSAPNPDHTHWFEMEQGTRVLDDEGNIIILIEIREIDDPPLEESTVVIRATYIIMPLNVTFSLPVIFTLGYGIDELPEDVSSIDMANYEEVAGWAYLEAKGDVVAGIGELSTDIEESGIYAILAGVTPQVPPASFQLANLKISLSLSKVWGFPTFMIRVGEDATVTALISNFGGQGGTYTASLKKDGVVIATQDVTLSPGQNQTITFDITGNEPGDYTVEIGGLSGEFTSTFWINWWLISGLSAALIFIAWAGWYYGYHRKKHKNMPI
ncbi:Ig-like domain-containing protein [Chloroflexota bacterium]